MRVAVCCVCSPASVRAHQLDIATLQSMRLIVRLTGNRCPHSPSAPRLQGVRAAALIVPSISKHVFALCSLQRRGFRVYVLPLERKDWFKVGRALFTRAYWSTSCTTHPGYTW